MHILKTCLYKVLKFQYPLITRGMSLVKCEVLLQAEISLGGYDSLENITLFGILLNNLSLENKVINFDYQYSLVFRFC